MADFHFGSKVFPSIIKVVEEAGEFVQAAMKLIGSRQWTPSWPAPKHVENLREEATDLYATLHFLFAHNPELLDAERFRDKMDKYTRWHREQADG